MGTLHSLAVSKSVMSAGAGLLLLALQAIGLDFPQPPAASATEETIQRTISGRELDPGDEPCWHYLWISTKNGTRFLYYFFGSTECGKGKIGFYQQNLYHVILDPEKKPPTVERVTKPGGMSPRFACG